MITVIISAVILAALYFLTAMVGTGKAKRITRVRNTISALSPGIITVEKPGKPAPETPSDRTGYEPPRMRAVTLVAGNQVLSGSLLERVVDDDEENGWDQPRP